MRAGKNEVWDKKCKGARSEPGRADSAVINTGLSPGARVSFQLAKRMLMMVTNRTRGAQSSRSRRAGVMSSSREKKIKKSPRAKFVSLLSSGLHQGWV